MVFAVCPVFSNLDLDMKLKQLFGALLATLAANMVLADAAVGLPPTPVPMEAGGLFALAAVCLAVGIRIVRRKRNR
jgi:MYXO-CTERM domain-containing protein